MNHALLLGLIVKPPSYLRPVLLRSQVQFYSLRWIDSLLLLLDYWPFGLKRTLSPGLRHHYRTLPWHQSWIAHLRFSAICRLWGALGRRVFFLESLQLLSVVVKKRFWPYQGSLRVLRWLMVRWFFILVLAPHEIRSSGLGKCLSMPGALKWLQPPLRRAAVQGYARLLARPLSDGTRSLCSLLSKLC
jgi:hypothetical protein